MARQTTALLTAILTSTQFLVAIASPDTSTNPAAKGKLPFSSFTHPDAVFHEQRKRQAAPGDGSSCDDAANIMRACVAAIPDYGSATDSELAGCVCCDDGKWGADYFDQPVSSCVTYLEENYPEETEMAHAYGGIAGFCSVIGSVSCLPGSVTEAATLAVETGTATTGAGDSQVTSGLAGCSSASSMIRACASEIPNMDDTMYEEIGACLCYDDTDWNPNEFDGYMDGCLSWASTEYSVYYSKIRDLGSLCSELGTLNVKGDTPSLTGATATPTATAIGGSFTGLGASSTGTVEVEPTATSNTGSLMATTTSSSRLGFMAGILGLYILL